MGWKIILKSEIQREQERPGGKSPEKASSPTPANRVIDTLHGKKLCTGTLFRWKMH